jgi:4-amino-4-deoxy-L-arabinose transferase-like glycosyltransferase
MLYSILAHFSMEVFGESAWAARLPAVLLGVASIWALFLLGRHVVGNTQALLACAVLTASYHHIWFSQNARGWIGLLLFAILATWLWLEALDHTDWRWWATYAIAIFLGTWVQMSMVLVIAAHGLLYLMRAAVNRRSSWMPFAAWFLGGTLILQGHALALPEFFRLALHEASLPGTEWTNPLWAIAEVLRSLRIGFSGFAVVAGGAVVATAGAVAVLRRNWMAGMSMLLPGFLCAAVLLGLRHNIWPRSFFFCMGFALLIVVHGAAVVPRTLRVPARLTGVAPIAIAGLLVAVSLATLPRGYALPKQDFIGARNYLEPKNSAGAAVAAIGLAGHAYKYYAPQWQFPATAAELDALRREHPNLALVYTLPIQLQALHPDLWKLASQEFEAVKVFPGTLNGGEVYVCRQRSIR